jgi:acyl-CoA synthetase (AMP-forming)/AMP-acid ligase II
MTTAEAGGGHATVAQLLRARAEEAPDALGVVLGALDGGWLEWSWAEYWEQARRAGAGLRAAGIGAGDHVVMLVLEVDTAVKLLFGAWAIGAVPILVGVPYRLTDVAGFAVELGRTAQRLDARALIVSDAFAAAAPAPPAGAPPVLAAGSVLAAADGALDAFAPVDPSAPAFVQLTSGSTGHPRGAVISHAALLSHLAAISEALPLAGPGAREVTWLPLHHDMGLVGGLLYPLFNGFAVNVMSPLAFRNDPFSWLQTLSDVRATCTPGPPSAYAIAARLAPRAIEAGLDLSALACAMVGAEPIAPALLRTFAESFAPCGFRPEAWFAVYGLAEATVAVTFPPLLGATRIDRIDRAGLERNGHAVSCEDGPEAIELTGVGRPLPGTELRIVRDGAPAGERVVGEIEVRAPSLMDGYYGEPEATAEALRDGWLRTGDLGYRAEGALFVTGRTKDLIIKGGHNLLPAAIEEIAGAVDGIRAGCVAAVGIASAQRATELVCVVCETKAADPGERTKLARVVRERLRLRGIAIDRVLLVEPGTIPRTTSGKIRRGEVARTLVASERGSG